MSDPAGVLGQLTRIAALAARLTDTVTLTPERTPVDPATTLGLDPGTHRPRTSRHPHPAKDTAMSEQVSVARWIPYDDAEDMPHSCGGLGGWFKEGNTWADYAAAAAPNELPYLEAIRDSVLASGRFLGGDRHQDDHEGVPLFSDGTVGTFTYRAWGDLMAAIATIKDGPVHNYMHFYMDCLMSEGGEG